MMKSCSGVQNQQSKQMPPHSEVPSHYFSCPRQKALRPLVAFSIRRKNFVIEAPYLQHIARPTWSKFLSIDFLQHCPASWPRRCKLNSARIHFDEHFEPCGSTVFLWNIIIKKKSPPCVECHPLLCSQSSWSAERPPTDPLLLSSADLMGKSPEILVLGQNLQE